MPRADGGVDLAEDERDGVGAVLEVVDRPLEGARGLGCCQRVVEQRVLQRVAGSSAGYGFDLTGLVRQAGVESVLYFPVGVRGEAQDLEIRARGKGQVSAQCVGVVCPLAHETADVVF